MFTNNYNAYYDNWIMEFNILSANEKSKIINDFVFMELDDYFLDHSICESDFSYLRYDSFEKYINCKDKIEIPINFLDNKFNIK